MKTTYPNAKVIKINEIRIGEVYKTKDFGWGYYSDISDFGAEGDDDEASATHALIEFHDEAIRDIKEDFKEAQKVLEKYGHLT